LKLFKKTYTLAELIEGCKDNDRRCQEKLYMRYFDDMYRMCVRHIKNEDETLSVLNSGFLKVFQNIDRFEHRGSFEGWVRRIIYRTMVEHFRGQKSYQNFIVLDEEDARGTLGKTSSSVLGELYYEDLLELLADITPKAATVFRLHAIEGFTHPEIGTQLEISENTSKWYLAKARKELQDLIKKNNENKTIA